MTNKIKWEEMFPDELYEKIRKEPVCYMPYGLAEPHGAYNALGLDWLKASALVERAAREHGGVVAPPCCWHMLEVPEFHGDGVGPGWFRDVGILEPLCSSIPADVYYHMVFHQIRAMDARGFYVGILVTGHYGGLEVTLRRMCDYYVRRTGSPIKLHAIADWECIRFDDYGGDHAGRVETSQLMELHPGLVDLDRKTAPKSLGPRFAGSEFNEGYHPSPELGKSIVDSQVAELGRVAKELSEAYEPKPGWKAPTQNDVVDIWNRFYRLTRRYASGTYAEYKSRQGKVGLEFPGWEALGE